MADNKKYYYLKLKDNFYDSEQLIILQNMQDGYLYSDILMKLYLRSLKTDGKLMFNNIIPYTPTILAQVVRHQVGTVEKALNIFQQLGLVEILDNGAIYMLDIQNFIGKSSTEADRQRQYYNKIKDENSICKISYKNSTPEIEIEKEIDIEIKKENKEKRKNQLDISLFLLSNSNFNDNIKNKLKEWVEYKKEKKEYYKETGFKSLLKQIENNINIYGEDTITNLIDECMANNYKGIIFDKLKNRQNKQVIEQKPEWFDKELKNKKMTQEDINEMDNLLNNIYEMIGE